MKVPKLYKQSDSYNAGTDIIYDDNSKLQYAPFILATTQSGDNGGDEEGYDIMVVNVLWDDALSRYKLDKTYAEIKSTVQRGNNVLCIETSDGLLNVYTLARVDEEEVVGGITYHVGFIHVTNGSVDTMYFTSDSETGFLVALIPVQPEPVG